jgi:hypothetical protein
MHGYLFAMIIAPSLLAKTTDSLPKKTLRQRSFWGARLAALDIMDGHFVPNISGPGVVDHPTAHKVVFRRSFNVFQPEILLRHFPGPVQMKSSSTSSWANASRSCCGKFVPSARKSAFGESAHSHQRSSVVGQRLIHCSS